MFNHFFLQETYILVLETQLSVKALDLVPRAIKMKKYLYPYCIFSDVLTHCKQKVTGTREMFPPFLILN